MLIRRISNNLEAMTRAIILLGFSAMLFSLIKSGKILVYINPRFIKLIEITALVMLIMFLAQAVSALKSGTHGKGINWAYLAFVLPLLMAFLLPATPLDDNLASNKGIQVGSRPLSTTPLDRPGANPNFTPDKTTKVDPGVTENVPKTTNAVQYAIKEIRTSNLILVNDQTFDLVYRDLNMYPEEYLGKEITVLGFVFKDPKMHPHQFGLVRFLITCCSADAVLKGFLCEHETAPELKEGNWIEVRGYIQKGQYGKHSVPVIKITSIKNVMKPQNPYVYPQY